MINKQVVKYWRNVNMTWSCALMLDGNRLNFSATSLPLLKGKVNGYLFMRGVTSECVWSKTSQELI